MPRVVRSAFACALMLQAAVSADAEESVRSEAAAPAKRRAISPHMAAVLMAVSPRYDPTKPPEKPVEPAREMDTGAEPDPSVVQLPKYMVNEGKLPTPEGVLSQKELERVAMERYLGPKDGLDRGFLNRFTIAEFWRKIPVIGKIIPAPFGSITNEQRAMERYYEDKRLKSMNDLLDLGTITSKTGDRALGEKIKRETKIIFMRD